MNMPPALDNAVWTVNPYSWEASRALADALDLPLVTAMVLAGRGITDPSAARMFLECTYPLPDPFLFAHMEAAVRLVSDAIDTQRRVVVHGDYDADGITATAVLVHGLRDLGIEAEWYLPSRFNEGYGLSRAAVETIASAGSCLLITVDCGVNYPDEVRLAKGKGLDVIVVDHHRPGPELPDCSVIHEVVGEYPHGDLCGVGLALKVLHALHVHRNGASRETLPAALHSLLDLVAVGTIADLAPLRGENRYYVKQGLKLIGIGRRVGLRELSAVASCSGVADSGTVAYRLAPRLNAAGRLADPSPPLRLLLTDDEKEARELASRLHELNGVRRDVERQILDEAVARVEALPELPAVLVLAGSEWHEGVVGIVASRLVERYHRPTVLLGVREGVAKGSGRSIPAYDLMAALNSCSECLTVYGGHRQAVGLTLDADNIDAFRSSMEVHARSTLEGRDLRLSYKADAILRGEDMTADVAVSLADLGPFGTGNPRPRLLVVDGSLEHAETTRNGAHLRCVVEVDGVRVRAIGFGLGELAASVGADGDGRTLGVQFRVDEWQGTLRPEFLLERIGASKAGEVRARGCEFQDATESETAQPMPVVSTRANRTNGGRRAALASVNSRDLRDRPGRFSAVAQVLASGQPTVLVASSASHTLTTLRRHLPLQTLCGDDFERHGWGDEAGEAGQGAGSRVQLVEWDALASLLPSLSVERHLVALDPPFREAHLDLLDAAEAGGAAVHLYYGQEERRATARLLRYLVHPRFAMVCLFRAMQSAPHGADDILTHAAENGWKEAQVVLSRADLQRAARVLEELGVGHESAGEAKLEVRSSPTYVAAEAEYEECVRLCLTL